MLNGVPTGSGSDYGLGVMVQNNKEDNLKIISHNGSQLGYQTNLIYIPAKKIIIAIAINSDSDVVSNIKSDVLADLLPVILQSK
jgi:CubicO group peptidase (beta-lactamase class C family)